MRRAIGVLLLALLLVGCGDQRTSQQKADSIFATFEAKITPAATNTPTRTPPPRPTPANCSQFSLASKMLACQATVEAAQKSFRATITAP